MQKFYAAFLALMAIVFSLNSFCQTNPTPQTIPYSQDFEELPHNVSVYPAGWQGWTIGTSNTSNFRTNAPTADRTMTASGSAGNNSGNVYNYNSKIGFLTTGSLDLALALAIDGTNSSNITVSYSAMTIRNPYDGSSNTRINEMILQYRIGTTGLFSNLVSTEYQNNTELQINSGITTPQNVQTKIIALPAVCNNQPVIQLRWVNRDVSGGGSRPSFAVDNILIQSSAAVSETVSVLAVNNAVEPDIEGSFKIILSAPAPEGGQVINYSFSGTATLGVDYTDPSNGSIVILKGNTEGIIKVVVIDDEIYEGPETIIINILNAGDYTITSGSATIELSDNDPSIINLNDIYFQDFNTLINTGSSSVLPLGWMFLESGTGANLTYTAGTGSGTAGDTYSFGVSGSNERAFGTLQSGSVIPSIGAAFYNNSNKEIYRLLISYKGEQWRLGAIGREDKLMFQISTDATSLNTGTWTSVNNLNFIAPVVSGTTGLLNGNVEPNNTLISYTIDNLNIPQGATFFIRWIDFNASGADDGLAIDDFSIEINPLDVIPPAITFLSPANSSNEIAVNSSLSVIFNESVQKGNGFIKIWNSSEKLLIQAIDVSSNEVAIEENTVNILINKLQFNTEYYVTIDAGTFEDLSGNSFEGIENNTSWNFTTGNKIFEADFQNCINSLTDGFTQYSEEGSVIWGCTAFGRDANNPPSGSAPNALQINGFINGANQVNTDWLISPAFDLTNTNYPIISFWSRTAFTGSPLKLFVSTNYTGTGDPNLATWTELNGKFPGTASDVWTFSDNINLTKYKETAVYLAFVYSSSSDDGARWTLDDITIRNDDNPPAPSLTALANDVQFVYVKGGETAAKEVSFAANDLVEDILVNATADFLVSKDGENFASSVTFNVAEANDVFSKLYIQFAPGLENQNYSGTVTISTSAAIATINVNGSSIDPAITLEVVNWNIEWFGSTVNGPRNEELQEQNVVKIMKEVNADVYGLMEIVDEAKLARVVNQLEGYAYTISDFGSHVNPFSGTNSTLAEAQKLAFVYKTSVVSVNEVRPMLSYELNTEADAKNNPSFYNWSSGRYPYLMDADVTLGGKTKNIKFVLVHAKANTAPLGQSYDRRKAGADALYDSLKILWPEQEIIVFGDFNDDLDASITTGYTTTSWNKFTEDEEEYDALTLPLSLAGKKSTVSYNDIIDHVVVSNEMSRWYMNSTASILTEVTGLVSNYGGTTSDHYPVFSRYIYCNITAPENIVVSNDEGQCGAVVNYTFTNTQTCGTVTADIESGSFFEVGTHTVTLYSSYGDVTTFTVTVNDTEKPVITAPATVTTSPNASGCVAINVDLGNPVTLDNCSVFNVTNNAPDSYPLGTTVVTWLVTDINGNTATATQNVVVRVDPAITSTIPDAFSINPGGAANTVYIGYSPASSITLNAEVSGGTAPYNYKWTIGSSSGRGFSNASSVTVSPTISSTTYYLNVEDLYNCVVNAATKIVYAVDVRCGPKKDKVSICQFVKGKWTTSCVLSKDVPALLASGATLGSCSNTTSIVTLTEPLLEQTIKGLSVLAMPNPSTAYFNLRIQSDNSGERILVRITDILGRTIEQFQNIPSTHVLRIGDNYKNGVYMVEVIQGSTKKHLKIIKNQ